MPKLAKPLSDTAIRRAKAGSKPVKLYDGGGLYIEVLPAGTKYWRFRYRQANGKENSVTFGSYPELSLAEARNKRTEVRARLLEGTDPAQHRAQVRRQQLEASKNTFRALATEWHALKTKSWSADYGTNVLHRLEVDIFPDLGDRPIAEVTHRELISVFRKIEQRGAHEIAKRNKAVCSQIFSYAIQAGIATRNPLADMKDVLQVVTPGNFPAISTDQLPAFLTALWSLRSPHAADHANRHASADARFRAHQRADRNTMERDRAR
jgi:hypothetical protein